MLKFFFVVFFSDKILAYKSELHLNESQYNYLMLIIEYFVNKDFLSVLNIS